MMKILNFGSCNVDYVYSLDHIVNAGETETTNNLSTFPGGKGLNQSIAMARAGIKVYHAGCIGADGEILTDILLENNVDTSFIKYTEEKNGHAIIQVSADGENSIFLYPGSNEMITKEHIDSVLKNFSKGDILLLQNEINNLNYIIKKAYEIGMCIILNPSPINEKIFEIDFNMLSYIILNEGEAQAISKKSEPEDSLIYFKNTYPNIKVMLTLGKNGCIFQDENQKVFHPIFEVKPVDTTAAGDTFTGYFVEGVTKNRPIKETLRLSSCASAIAVSKNGAAPSIPFMKDVTSSIDSMKIKKQGTKSEVILKKAEKYIEENIKTATLEELAEILGYSPVYTANLIKKITGTTFKKILQERRLLLSSKLLLDTDLSISEIIKEAGYENESFFREIFKKKYNKNPLEYKKDMTGEKI